jgi:hypothetical protein
MSHTTKAVGVGLVAGGLLLAAPAGIAFADSALTSAVNGANGAVQNVVNLNNQGAQGITAINNTGLQANTATNNTGLQAGVSSLNDGAQLIIPTTTSTLTSLNGLVKFSVQGLLGK